MKSDNVTGFNVIQPGLLTLIQDAGRFGQHRIGLTNGGPLDANAFKWANRLLNNDLNSTALEVSIGGLVLEAQVDTFMVVTGAKMPLKINGVAKPLWQAVRVQAGDKIELGFSTEGARAYLAVAGGFDVDAQFTSTATVMREGIGGLKGDKLAVGDRLACAEIKTATLYGLPEKYQPTYTDNIGLRVIKGYQIEHFSRFDQRMFFSSDYRVSNLADRMGYRLSGPKISPAINGILSEGICHGAIQIPADGQPIVLLNDRQTIGGYPKIGSMIALDTARMAQLLPGASIHFEEVTIDDAHNAFCLEHMKFQRIQPEQLS